MEQNKKYKLPVTWQWLHENVVSKVFGGQKTWKPNEFMSQIFPETIFDMLFSLEGMYYTERISTTYSAEDGAEKTFNRMRDYLLEDQRISQKPYTYDTCSAVSAFQETWEALIPDLKMGSEIDSQALWIIQESIQEIIADFPKEYTNLSKELTSLGNRHQYSLILAILSIIATTLSSFGKKGRKYSLDDTIMCSLVQNAAIKEEASGSKSSNVPITLEILHNDIFKELKPESKLTGKTDFAVKLVPEYLWQAMHLDVHKKPAKKYINAIYDANFEYAGRTKYRQLCNCITGMTQASRETPQYSTSPVVLDYQLIWEMLLPESHYTVLDEEQRGKALQDKVNALLDSIPDDPLHIRIRLIALCRTAPYSLVLAILSVIATTVRCFTEPSGEEDERLYAVVLPPMPEKHVSSQLKFGRRAVSDTDITYTELKKIIGPCVQSLSEKGEAAYLLYQKALQENRQQDAETYLRQSVKADYLPAKKIYCPREAEKKLIKARELFNDGNQNDINLVNKCCEQCEEILEWSAYISKACRGEANFILYLCMSEKGYIPKKMKGKNNWDAKDVAKRYLEISHQCGFEKATTAWEALQQKTLIVPQPARSKRNTVGICCSNTDNLYGSSFKKTVPAGWHWCSLDLKNLERNIDDPTPQRFLLLDNDFTKNLEELFEILKLVQENEPDADNLKWEIFIRHNSESIHMLIDTAMARIPDYSIPIYILNDAQIAAQQLLAQHPLYYPARFLSLKKTNVLLEQRPLLHFVILGDSDITEWLVREAFSILGFRNNAIRAKITVLAETGERFRIKLMGRFPGMFKNKIEIKNIELPGIYGENVELDSQMLTNYIEDVFKETPYCYFAVATDSYECNLTLATQVREMLIRLAIRRKEEAGLLDMPAVAFYCNNDQIAHLSRSMVVENERHGFRWFNTRSLIPFGEISRRYTFDNITGGTFADLAKCIHFQYSQKTTDDVLARTEESIDTEKDFYQRQYNQDSSYSIALSMPYRLFQFSGRVSGQLIPEAWDIRKDDTFSSVERLKKLSVQLQEREKDTAEEYEEIAEWEHARWVRWMLSRGWMPATFDDAVFAYKCGNPRQQLFACKMHPCICSYGELKKLSEVLDEQCGLKKNFYTYDLDNIRDTKKLIALEWVSPKKKEAEKETER